MSESGKEDKMGGGGLWKKIKGGGRDAREG